MTADMDRESIKECHLRICTYFFIVPIVPGSSNESSLWDERYIYIYIYIYIYMYIYIYIYIIQLVYIIRALTSWISLCLFFCVVFCFSLLLFYFWSGLDFSFALSARLIWSCCGFDSIFILPLFLYEVKFGNYRLYWPVQIISHIWITDFLAFWILFMKGTLCQT